MPISGKKFWFVSTFTALLCVCGTSISHSDSPVIDVNEGWAVPNSSGAVGSHNALFTDANGFATYSSLVDSSKISNKQVDPTCTSTSDTRCDFTNFDFVAQIPVCQSTSDQNCIVSIGATDKYGKDYPGIFQKYYPEKAQNQFVGNVDWNLPDGVSGSLFTIPGVNGPAGNTYYTSLVMSGHGSSQQTPKVSLGSVAASITPVQVQDISDQFSHMGWCKSPGGVCNDGYNLIDAGQSGNSVWGRAGANGNDGIHVCLATSWLEKSCAEKEAFPTDFSFYLKARFTLPPTGWLHGRLSDPDITITQAGKVTELKVSAEPVAVPIVYKPYLWVEMPPELQALYDPSTGNFKNSTGGNASGFVRSIQTKDPLIRSLTIAPEPYDQNAIPELTAWLPYVNNTAAAVPHYWTFESLTPQELTNASRCFTNTSELNGIVDTNSTAYSPGPPSFDKTSGSLNYQVAAPHYSNSGEVFRGLYDLVMRASVAQCVYGFSNAPVKASISVISAAGSPEVATTVVAQKGGWLHLSARNFEFSAPTIAVKLTQDEPLPATTQVNPGSATAKPSSKVAKPTIKRTITCSNGKSLIRVTAQSPKCPTGFKLKTA